MRNIDKFVDATNNMISEEQRKYENAVNEKELYSELKNEAIKKERAAKNAMKELELAKLHAKKAQVSYASSEGTKAQTIETTESYASTDGETVHTEETVYVTEKSGKVAKGVVNLIVAGLLLVGGAYGYKLYRESKTGDVKSADEPTKTANDTVRTNPETVNTENNTVTYNSENNEVIVVSGTEAETKEEIQVVKNETAVNAETQTTAGSYSFNYDNSAVVANDTEYVELTNDAFETLTAETINTLRGYNLQVSDEDVIKYVMIRNIDKLRQDNNEMITNIIGDQDPIEAFADADSVIDAIMTYNLLYFDANHNTDGFISASVGVFDEIQKARVLEIEKRVYEIGAYYQDEEKYNELTASLLRDMINPTMEISELEDGVSYGVEWIDMYMVRATFGTDRYIKLNPENADKIKYFVSFVGDGEEYEDNALVNGNVRNINALLTQCTNEKTRTR